MPNRLLLFRFFACVVSAASLLRAQPPTRASVDTQSLRLPVVGDCTLLILTPTLLEFTQISGREKGAPSALIADASSGARTASAVPTFEVTIGDRPLKVMAVGIKRRVAYAPVARRDLRITTQFYLRLAEPLSSDAKTANPVVQARGTGGVIGKSPLTASAPFDPKRTSPVIHVNQEGYAPALPKRAMVGYYLGDMGEMDISGDAGFELIDARGGESVYKGKLTPRYDTGYKTSPLPYQRVLEADFSDFKTPGEYRLLVRDLGASLPFLIDDGIAMGFARTYALGLYEQRCGGPNELPFTRFVHDACHVAPAAVPSPQSDDAFKFTWTTIARYAAEVSRDNPAQTAPALTSEAKQLYPFVNKGPVDVSGGHHDAGDYSKYTINSAELVHYLMFTADSIPGVAEMDNLGIRESGDGISDVLQEAKWEADYLSKLQDADGGFYFLVYPKTREYESNVLPDHGEPQVVWPKNTAVTAAATAALAQCASSPLFKKQYPEVAAKYLKQAQLGWQFLTKAIAKYGKAGAYQKITFYGDHFTHDDELVWAACELFLATGDKQYWEKLSTWLPNPADYTTFRWGWWRMSESWGNAIRSYAFAARSGRLPQSALDQRYLRICEGEVISAADNAVGWSKQNAYATPFPTPTKIVRGGGWYFSLDQASDIAVAYQIEPKPVYLDALVGAMNYEGGTNPVNVTYVTGLGQKRQREIVDQYAQNDRRVLPPSGIPLGNIQAAFQYMPNYGGDLRDATYPTDDSTTSAFPLYDRWSDAFNVTTEFIAVNQARALLSTIVLAQQSAAAKRPWKALPAEIVVPRTTAQLNTPLTLRVEVPGEDLTNTRVVWEARDQEPAFGPTYTITPKNNGAQWVEAEVEWPDGRRAVGAGTFTANGDTVAWVDDALPTDASPSSSGGDGWNWISADPAPKSGTRAHQSNLAAGLHEHWFTDASAPLAVATGDVLFAWVWLDPKNPPTEIMLMWNDGSSWEHRAYWGANKITYGKDGAAGRFAAGALPATGKWIRLSVPARAVGLEGATVNGMGFSQFDGRATWDAAGRAAGSARAARVYSREPVASGSQTR